MAKGAATEDRGNIRICGWWAVGDQTSGDTEAMEVEAIREGGVETAVMRVSSTTVEGENLWSERILGGGGSESP